MGLPPQDVHQPVHHLAHVHRALVAATFARPEMSEDSEDIAYAIRMLISVGRARQALPLAERCNKVRLPSDLLVEVLQEAACQPFENNGDSNEAAMFQHYVAEILQLLDECDDVDRNA